MQIENPPSVIETQDVRIAAAVAANGHRMREADPCIWFCEGQPEVRDADGNVTQEAKDYKEFGIFFFPEDSEGKGLSVRKTMAAWRDRGAPDRLLALIEKLSPPHEREENLELVHIALVQGMRVQNEFLKHYVQRELHSSRERCGFHRQQYANVTVLAGKGMSEADVSAMKQGIGQ